MREKLIAAGLRICLLWPTVFSSRWCQWFRRAPRSAEQPLILLVRLDGLGDCVMTLPLLDQLRRRFPSGHITVVTQAASETLFRDSGYVDEVLVLRPIWSAVLPRRLSILLAALHLFWNSLSHSHFDIAINPRLDTDVNLATFLCGLTRAPITVGYEDGTSTEKLAMNPGFQRTWNVLLAARPLQHEVLSNLAVGLALGCEARDLRPTLTIAQDQREQARRWLQRPMNSVIVGLGLPAGQPKRRWSAEGYLKLLHLLEKDGPVTPVVFTDPPTATMAKVILEEFPNARVAHLLPLPQVAAILSECTIFIGSDSGLGHIAAAAECATVTLSCHPVDGNPSHHVNPQRFRPYGPRSVVVQPRTSRSGCEAGCNSNEPHCILQLDPNDIAQVVRRILDIERGTHPQATKGLL